MTDKPTNIVEKLIPSIINMSVALILSMPFFILWGMGLRWKFAVITILFLYNLGFAFLNGNRCLGMIITKTYWQKTFNLSQKFVYVILYTLSFSTVLVWIYFPFDLLLANLLLLQLPLVVSKQTTLHGYLSGNNRTIKSK